MFTHLRLHHTWQAAPRQSRRKKWWGWQQLLEVLHTLLCLLACHAPLDWLANLLILWLGLLLLLLWLLWLSLRLLPALTQLLLPVRLFVWPVARCIFWPGPECVAHARHHEAPPSLHEQRLVQVVLPTHDHHVLHV